jgi:hypothetical protein
MHVEATRHDAGQETGYALGPYVPEQFAALLGRGQWRPSSCLISCTTVGGVRPGSRYSERSLAESQFLPSFAHSAWHQRRR